MGKKIRELIKTSVYSLVRTGGFATLSTQRIAESSGMTKGNLYNYFSDKGNLIIEAYNDIEQALWEATSDFEKNPELSDKENLKQLWKRFYSFFEHYSDKAAYYVIFRNIPAYFDLVKDNNQVYSNVFSHKIAPYLKIDEKYKSTICEVILHSTVKMLERATETESTQNDLDFIFETIFRGIC